MNRERALALQQRGLADWIALLGSSSPGARTLERDGLIASIVPDSPQRSICNSVAYTDGGELAEALEELAEAYERAGIRAWTVWAPGFDADAIEALEAAGHKLDGTPTAMSMELADFEPLDLGDLDWDRDPEPGMLGRLNDLAYDLSDDSLLSPALAAPPELPGLRLYQARVDGEPAAILGTLDHHGLGPERRRGSATPPEDLGFYFVATHPDHRGRGLASRLMSVAIVEGRERGLLTSSLQASPMGRPVYARLGYADDFTLTMYERRR